MTRSHRKTSMNKLSLLCVSIFILLLPACVKQDVPVTSVIDQETSLRLSATVAGLVWGRPNEDDSVTETPVFQSTATWTQESTLDPSVTPTPLPSPSPTVQPVASSPIQLLFTGTIVTGRCVQAAVDEQGNADFLYDDVRNLISGADYAVGLLNSSISDYPPHTGCVSTFVLVGNSEHADAMERAGFDMMHVATNHIKNCGLTNCGDQAFLDTLENLRRVGIVPVGAGLNLDEALEPVIVEIKGVRFGFVAQGEIEKDAFASDEKAGIAVLTDENLITAIKKAKEKADVVIAMPHWGSDYSHVPNYRQLHFAEVAVEAGADLVVGNHAHVIQGYQMIHDVPVFYGLGSFIFDQDWSLETQQGLLLLVTFVGTQFKDFEVVPVHINGNGKVVLAEKSERLEILEQFNALSERLNRH